MVQVLLLELFQEGVYHHIVVLLCLSLFLNVGGELRVAALSLVEHLRLFLSFGAELLLRKLLLHVNLIIQQHVVEVVLRVVDDELLWRVKLPEELILCQGLRLNQVLIQVLQNAQQLAVGAHGRIPNQILLRGLLSNQVGRKGFH